MSDGAAKERSIPWWHPVLGREEADAVSHVVLSQYLNDGPLSGAFAARIAELCGSRFGISVTSGTMALFVALSAAEVGPGDEVLVPDLTFIATANAVTLTGARAVLVDVDPATGCMDPEAARRARTARTRAMLPVHLSGRPAPMKELAALSRDEGWIIIEDAAEALGSKHAGKPLGSWGKAGCFSFSPMKTITTGQGGVVVTDDEGLYSRMVELKDQGRPVRGTGGADQHVSLGYNFKLTDMQAAVGLAQLRVLESRIAHLRMVASTYHERLRSLPGFTLLPWSDQDGVVLQWVDAKVRHRDALHDHLLKCGIQCRKFWYPLHTQSPYKEAQGLFPGAEEVSAQGLWLPSALSLGMTELELVCKTIADWAT